MYVKRDKKGHITAISSEALTDFEKIDDEDAQLKVFIESIRQKEKPDFVQSDLEMSRVLEDVIDLLIDRQIIRFTDLPPEAQRKLNDRHHLRTRHSNLRLLDEDDGMDI